MLVPLPKKIASKTFTVHFLNTINSHKETHRMDLRENIAQTILQRDPQANTKNLFNLEELPSTPGYSISLSHCPNGSAYILADNNDLVGLDIESIARVTQPIIQRISSPLEITNTPKPEYLFSAKEATWKALNKKLSLQTISQLTTKNWQQIETHWYQFETRQDDELLDGIGYCHQINNLILSFFVSG